MRRLRPQVFSASGRAVSKIVDVAGLKKEFLIVAKHFLRFAREHVGIVGTYEYATRCRVIKPDVTVITHQPLINIVLAIRNCRGI